MTETPKELGYSMPAEWEKHSAVWLAWPYDVTTFPNIVPDVEISYCEIIKALEGSEKVNLIIRTSGKERIEKMLIDSGADMNNIVFFEENYGDVWTRDYAPITLFNKEKNNKVYVKWNYNVYGKGHEAYFADLVKDDKVFNNIIDESKYKVYRPEVVLEGGAIESNGRGTLMTTEQCLLNFNRNGDFSKEQYEKYLKDYLGVENIIWLKNGIINDHTDGHIDEVARFVAPDTIVCAYEDDINDPNFHILDDNFSILTNAVDKDGNKFKVIKLPMPHMDYDDGVKAPVSYANFYIGNSVVLMSVFNDENDEKAKGIIQSLFPNHKIIGIDCTKIIYGGGAIHCMTMQEYSDR
ncbi:MAG: Agmatine deiminase [Candidatus Nomurabacteria bacterium GW2011_GWF2_35_66]|uniref:Agmatine deiminase n=1 Tax=Candidatus Nomurabacteria bacterium GW2011_GWE1_35_16 TaxID=1618761 RepID=A0A0G0BAU4_9BACT|nr:MAG: Agmatine deiminase [Candidatus Nomurabacteria bacterium GW2011_GWF1_34_20]KKP63361.1 MAG: Agmatine deiminase [Candidatus Nomurabacteria bacterium GW2011_GWE2_34_25]KKP66553.1 MAG: Agmatine deiminase [Candidatus Nomurabacteria bacterium GW2011_GWE1_35_16]KKP83599.1 MAG: Agmatine deiminase [Candidatus Nomurabacteria bacterium GW2011_GWF2_35_66]HAE36860.1 agmatine deiminase [Candidatus Nomurabacteria bacterium]